MLLLFGSTSSDFDEISQTIKYLPMDKNLYEH